MRSILRQIVAVLALVGIVSTIVPSTFAETYTAQAAADKLAASNFIVDQSATPAAYRLADNLLRQEAIGTAANVLGLLDTPLEQYVCQNKFSDVSATLGWVCRAAELAANAGLTNAANATFRPKDNLTRFEALVFALRAAGLVPSGSLSQSELIELGADAGLITSSAGFNSNAAATRGEFFQYVVRGLDSAESPELCDILGICPEEGGGGQTTGGAVTVSLASSNPIGYTVPKGANSLHVASYKVYANADTSISAVKLKRMGLADDIDTENFAVLVNGVRATDAKDENSDDEVTLTFKSGGVFIKKGESATFDVLMNVASAATTGAEIAVALVEMTAGGSVSGLPVTGSVFKVGSSVASQIDIESDGSVSSPSLGREGADLFRFKVKNDASNDTMTLRGITFKHTGGADENTDLKNFKLMKGGETLATVASTNSQYVSFVLATPLSINSGNTVSLKVVADVVGGAGETIAFEINSELDVMASSTRFGNAIDVSLVASTFGSVTVKAGTLTLVKMNPTSTKIREDKDDVILGSFTVTAAQTGLELKEFGIRVTTSDTGAATLDSSVSVACTPGTEDSNCYLENVQLRVKETGATYDLSMDADLDGTSREYYDASLDYSLIKGTQTFEIIADTVNGITDFDDATFALSLAADIDVNDTEEDGGFLVEETADDTVVTDITPASLSWNNVDGSESGLTAAAVNTGIQNVVVGGDAAALKFTLDSDESSSSKIDEVTVVAHSSAGLTGLTSANQVFTQAKLYKGSVSDANLLKTESASDFAFNGGADTISVTFDDFMHTIAANTVDTFVVVFTLVDDTNLSATVGTLDTVVVSAVSAEDTDGDDITVSGLSTSDLGNTVVVGVGTLAVSVDNDNAKSDFDRNVVGGVTSPYVAGFKLVATNEAIRLKDVEVEFTDSGSDFVTSVNSVSLYNSSDVLISTKTVSGSQTIVFNDINFTVNEGTNYVYVKVNTNGIGKNLPGAQTADMTAMLEVTDAEGSSSGDTLGAIAQTSASNEFKVVPVAVSAVAFVSSYGGTNVATTLTGATDVVGILAVTSGASANSKAADGSALKLELDDVRIQIEKNSGVTSVDTVRLIKINGSDSDGVTGTGTCNTLCIFDTNSMTGEDELIVPGTTSYYKIEVSSTLSGTGTATLRPKLNLLDGGTTGTTASIEYSSDDSATLVTDVRLDFTSLNGNAVSVSQ